MVNFIVWPLLGGALGWVTSMAFRGDTHPGVWLNVVVGTTGALLGSWLLGALAGAGPGGQGTSRLSHLLVALLGATVVLVLVNLVLRATPH